MSAEGNRRLLVLADFLEKSVTIGRFTIDVWVSSFWKGDAGLSCGAAACAVGWATTIPEFQALGLKLERDEEGFPQVKFPGAGNSFAAPAVLFEIHQHDSDRLFLPDFYVVEDEKGEEKQYDPTPKEVAARIRAFVAKEIE